MGLFLFQVTAQWREAARCSSVTRAVASLALSLESLWSGSCMWGKIKDSVKGARRNLTQGGNSESLFWPTNRTRRCLFHMNFSTFLDSLVYLQSVYFDAVQMGILNCVFLFYAFAFGHSLAPEFGVKQELKCVWFIEMEFHIMFHGIYMVLIPSGEKNTIYSAWRKQLFVCETYLSSNWT